MLQAISAPPFPDFFPLSQPPLLPRGIDRWHEDIFPFLVNSFCLSSTDILSNHSVPDEPSAGVGDRESERGTEDGGWWRKTGEVRQGRPLEMYSQQSAGGGVGPDPDGAMLGDRGPRAPGPTWRHMWQLYMSRADRANRCRPLLAPVEEAPSTRPSRRWPSLGTSRQTVLHQPQKETLACPFKSSEIHVSYIAFSLLLSLRTAILFCTW